MLKCKQVAEQASDYLDKDQSLMQRLSWRMHLFMCKHCRRFVKNLRLTCEMAAQKELPEGSDKEVERVMECIADSNKSENEPSNKSDGDHAKQSPNKDTRQ